MTQLQGWAVAGKSWVALFGSLLTFVIPTLVQMSTTWPEPWPAVIGAVVAVLTAIGVYHAPYRPVPGSRQAAQYVPPTPWPVD